MKQKALEIAEEHFRRVNPSLWDGAGEPPAIFFFFWITYCVNRYTELDVSFERDSDSWRHCCKLRDTMTNTLLTIRYGPEINSPQRLVDTILGICKEIGGIHLNYAELKQIFQDLKRTSPREDLTAHIIFTEDSFDKPYSLLSRTYSVSSNNNGFWPGLISRSIFAYCLDVTSDQGVRLDWYMAEEGNPGGWKVETCYILERMRDVEAIPDLAKATQDDGTTCYFFGDTTIRAYKMMDNGRFVLKPVAGNQINSDGWVDLDIDRVYGYCTLLERYLNKEVG
ncbi:MAG: hypothetical protein HDT20_02305 [Oscillibacter sp.]|nr:hypothetical protein [Oscillibacter sp.]